MKFKDCPPTMDDEPCAVYSTQHYENTTLRQTSRGDLLCEIVVIKLP
jgi:hypothetical protein